jgi:hypothetical protein
MERTAGLLVLGRLNSIVEFQDLTTSCCKTLSFKPRPPAAAHAS